MQPIAIHLSQYILEHGEWKCKDTLLPKLQRMHKEGKKVHLIDVDGSIIAKNNLSRKNYPWINPQNSIVQWMTIEELWENRQRPQTRKECVFYAIHLLGDQTSLDTLVKYAKEFYNDALDDENKGELIHPVMVKQRELCQTALNKYGIDFWEVDSRFDAYLSKYRWKIGGEITEDKFYELWNKWAFIYNSMYLEKYHCQVYRLEWRKQFGSTVDCRTYNGQPERDMLKAA